MCTGWTCRVARAQELNSHFPTPKPAPPPTVPVSPASLSCSGPKPWDHPDSFLSFTTHNPVQWQTPDLAPLTPFWSYWPPCFALDANMIPPQGLCICWLLCLKRSTRNTWTWTADSLPSYGSLLREAFPYPPIRLPCFIILKSTYHFLFVLTDGSPDPECKLHQGRLSQSLSCP